MAKEKPVIVVDAEGKQETKRICPHVHIAVNEVKAAIAKTGISKDRSNQQQGYKFRGIDDVYNALAPIMAEANLVVYPTVLKREVVERVNQKGTALFYTTVEVRFDFVSAIDGSERSVVTYGEAMDSGDKATNKAMSAALKYAYMQTFCIPTEGDNDADAQTHEVIANAVSMAYDPEQNKQAYEQALKTISGFDTVEKIETYFKTNKNKLNKLPKDYFEDIIQACANQKSSINNTLNGAAH